jgi:hypothetical protein
MKNRSKARMGTVTSRTVDMISRIRSAKSAFNTRSW